MHTFARPDEQAHPDEQEGDFTKGYAKHWKNSVDTKLSPTGGAPPREKVSISQPYATLAEDYTFWGAQKGF